MDGTIIRLFIISTVLSSTFTKEYILEDLVAMENNNRRIINNIGEEKSPEPSQRPVRQKKPESSNEKKKEDDDDEDKKTLAQQVADGKYGLIQAEIFNEEPKRPGIISYEVNPEVPKDNVNNLGGLKPEEIWLAENHLLVLAGGGYPERDKDSGNIWPPIDNYHAPLRQVKIPPNPKVPPPFPVQLRPGGPTEFIRGENGTGGPPPLPPFFPPPGNFSGRFPPPGPFFPPGQPGNFTPGNGPYGIPPPFPYPARNGSFPPLPPNFPPPGFPGGNFPVPPGNFTDQFDEDDPSIYYPPPYDFVYRKDNSSAVPPGPLVPGIVLPPPPDFFAPLEDPRKSGKTRRPTSKSRKPPTTIITTRKPTILIKQHQPQIPTTTRRPSVQIVTDDPTTLNEVTPGTLEHILPPNAVVQDWVPIPAPRPFYITGPRKNIIKTTPVRKDYLDGYIYNKPETRYPSDGWIITNISQPVVGYNVFGVRPDQGYVQPSSTVPPVPYESTTVPPRGKSLKTFYFYEEPQEEPKQQEVYNNPQRPVQYFYPTTPPPSQYYYITTSRPSVPVETSTNKPPVYEYSYTAPGYGIVQPPKVGTTPAPNQDPVYYDYGSSVPETPIKSTVSPYKNNHNTIYTTARPYIPGQYRYTTAKPWTTTSSPFLRQTQHPYHAYFTHQDAGLIDEITKKYFTIFGQKLNHEVTTPLPPVTENIRNKVKFPSSQYYTTPAPYRPDYGYYDTGNEQQLNFRYNNYRAPTVSLKGDTDVNYKHPRPSADPDAEVFDPNLLGRSLGLTSHQGSSSLISYKLPGNGGGHFYFLTPQSIQESVYQSGDYYKRDVKRRLPKRDTTNRHTDTQDKTSRT